MPALYIVATPIGNLADITLRALDTLKAVDLIVCEDTRHSGRLLSHYGIKKPLLSGHSHNEKAAASRIVARLHAGEDVAYVSDAGTPGVSDPARALVRAVRDAGFPVIPLPGPSTLAALLSVSGFPGKTVVFEGFLSPKPGRRRNQLTELLETKKNFVLFESPHRLVKLMTDIADLDSERQVLLGREISKVHEEFLEGTSREVLAVLEQRQSIKGECAILVGMPKKG